MTRPLDASPAARPAALPAAAEPGLRVPALISKKLPAVADTLTPIKRRWETSSELLHARCFPTQRSPVKTESSCRKYLELLAGQGNAFFYPEMCLRLPVLFSLPHFLLLAAVGYRTVLGTNFASRGPSGAHLSPAAGAAPGVAGHRPPAPPPPHSPHFSPLAAAPLPRQGPGLQSAFLCGTSCGDPRV